MNLACLGSSIYIFFRCPKENTESYFLIQTACTLFQGRLDDHLHEPDDKYIMYSGARLLEEEGSFHLQFCIQSQAPAFCGEMVGV